MNGDANEERKLKNLRVLLVEDEEFVRQTLLKMMGRYIDVIYTAGDGEEGLALFRKHRPNVIVSDINMPNMDGLEMTEAIRREDPHVPIILTTAFNDQNHLIGAFEAGASRFLVKPVDRKKLRFYLEEYEEMAATRHALAARSEILEQYRMVVDQTMLVSKTDPKGIITYANQRFCEISGYSLEELVGNPHNMVRHPEMPAKVFKNMWETIRAGKMWHGVVKNLKKGGGYYIVHANVFPILDDDGDPEGYISIREDITDTMKKAEQEQLRKEKEHLEKLAATKERFLVVFTHELKTPLNAIINFSKYVMKMVGRSDLTNKDELVGLLDEVRQNGDDMLTNINQILDIGKMKEHKIELRTAPFDLAELAREVIRQNSALTGQDGIKADYRGPETCTVESDRQRFKQILTNLFSNAVKYGKDTIDLRLEEAQGRFRLSVEDNGPGIRDKSGVFELFEQEDTGDLARKAKGTGIGLHFVRELCRYMGLEVELTDSPELGGAKFTISGKATGNA